MSQFIYVVSKRSAGKMHQVAVAALFAITVPCLISGPTYLPCQQPQQTGTYQQSKTQSAAPNTEQPAAKPPSNATTKHQIGGWCD